MLDIKPTTAKKALQKPCPYCEERLKRPTLAISPSDVVIDEKGNAKPAAAYVCRHHLLCSHIYGIFAAAESHRLIWFELANARRGQIIDRRPPIRHRSLRARVVAKLIALLSRFAAAKTADTPKPRRREASAVATINSN